MDNYDTDYTDEMVCPYCGHENSDSQEYLREHSTDGEAECGRCGETFVWSADFSVSYSTSKKGCE